MKTERTKREILDTPLPATDNNNMNFKDRLNEEAVKWSVVNKEISKPSTNIGTKTKKIKFKLFGVTIFSKEINE